MEDEELSVDRRTTRSTSTKRAIAQALLELIEEGNLTPPAHRVAGRAGVSLRLIFHHFDDMESLFAVASELYLTRISKMTKPIRFELDLPERSALFVNQRARILEKITPVTRAAILQRQFSDEITKASEAFGNAMRSELFAVFGPELSRRTQEDRRDTFNALDIATCWVAWDHMRTFGSSIKEARQTMLVAVTRILAEAGGS